MHLNELHDGRHSMARFQIRKDEWPVAAHSLRIGIHDSQRCADVGGQIDPRLSGPCLRITSSELFEVFAQSQALALIV
jgi:hypothetical protein